MTKGINQMRRAQWEANSVARHAGFTSWEAYMTDRRAAERRERARAEADRRIEDGILWAKGNSK